MEKKYLTARECDLRKIQEADRRERAEVAARGGSPNQRRNQPVRKP